MVATLIENFPYGVGGYAVPFYLREGSVWRAVF